ncbi:unnamed protein product [Rotaria sp. Silwood1]|nr:unnamed protein product [Rotaria sp. Silwood1]
MLYKSEINEYSMTEQVKIATKSGFKLNHSLILTMYNVFHYEKRFYFMLEYAPHGQRYRFFAKITWFYKAFSCQFLVDCCGNLKLEDFGWNTTACCTLDYLAPEIVGHKQYQYQVDN